MPEGNCPIPTTPPPPHSQRRRRREKQTTSGPTPGPRATGSEDR